MTCASNPVVLFGGTFDPFHAGHAKIIAASAELPAQQTLVVPNGSPPHRGAHASWHHRLEMARIGTAGHAQVSEIEPPGAIRWTADTAATLRERGMHPILAVGSDSFSALASWQDWRALLGTVSWAVVPRTGSENWLPVDSEASELVQQRVVDDVRKLAEPGHVWKWQLRVPAISSTELRAKIADGQPGWEKMLPAKVAAYVASHGLYRADKTAGAGRDSSSAEAVAVCDALIDGKAMDVLALDTLRNSGGFFECMVVCTANSLRHAEALAQRVRDSLKKQGARAPVREGPGEPCWILLDAGNVVVQIMTREARELYRLEEHWQPPGQ